MQYWTARTIKKRKQVQFVIFIEYFLFNYNIYLHRLHKNIYIEYIFNHT